MITLIGHGFIGSAIARELEAQHIDYRHVTHKTFVPGGSAIINAAGYTGTPNVDACEDHKEECIEGNILWPNVLKHASAGLPIVHISSGCVYTGYEKEWTEDDDPNFDFTSGSFYSGTKAMFDRQFRRGNVRDYLLRIRLPFGPEPHPKNLLTKLQGYAKIVPQLQSMSYVPDVAKAAVWFALNKPEPGIYNCVNPGSVMTTYINEVMGFNKPLFTADDFRAAIKSPRSECLLSTKKMNSVFVMQRVVDALAKCKAQFGL